MSRVEIEAGGRRVLVEHDAELAELAKTAEEVWSRTAVPDPSPGPAFGFQADRRWSPAVQPSSARRAPYPAPLQGEADDAAQG